MKTRTMQLVLTVAYGIEESAVPPPADVCQAVLANLVVVARKQGQLNGDYGFVVDSHTVEIVDLDPGHEKPDSFWSGAIDALHSQGHDSSTIRDMIVNMGCDPDDADAHCGIE